VGHQFPEDQAGATDLHLGEPVPVIFSIAVGPVDVPAEVAGLKFPGAAAFTPLSGTFLDFPAVRELYFGFQLQRKQQQHLTFDSRRDMTPSLLKALDRLRGDAKQLSQLILAFLQAMPDPDKLFRIHAILAASRYNIAVRSYRLQIACLR